MFMILKKWESSCKLNFLLQLRSVKQSVFCLSPHCWILYLLVLARLFIIFHLLGNQWEQFYLIYYFCGCCFMLEKQIANCLIEPYFLSQSSACVNSVKKQWNLQMHCGAPRGDRWYSVTLTLTLTNVCQHVFSIHLFVMNEELLFV